MLIEPLILVAEVLKLGANATASFMAVLWLRIRQMSLPPGPHIGSGDPGPGTGYAPGTDVGQAVALYRMLPPEFQEGVLRTVLETHLTQLLGSRRR